MHEMHDGRFIISHVVRGQWSALDRENEITAWAQRDKTTVKSGSYEVGVEKRYDWRTGLNP